MAAAATAFAQASLSDDLRLLYIASAFVPPERLVEALTPDAPAHPPPETASLELTGGDLRAVRRFVAGAARDAGLTTERVDELVLAASELVANAAIHGRRPIGVHLWRDAGELVRMRMIAGGT